jgi:predicted oxidoreductase
MKANHYQADALIIGAGLAGVSTALELLAQGQRVLLVDAASREQFGGQANDAFGGMLLIDTHEQKRNGIKDSPELLLSDWMRAAAFREGDQWGPRWARAYAEHCRTEIYDWLRQFGIRFFPIVQWVERGNFGDGNSLPRYHIAWGCGRGVVQTLIGHLLDHPRRERLTCLFEHRVTGLEQQNGRVLGCRGLGPDGEFHVQAEHTVVCSGGINGNLDKVREHWDPVYGPAPDNLLSGTSPVADGFMHEQVEAIGGQVVNLRQMWNYAAGIVHPEPQFPQHGLSLIPPRSALWMDSRGRRIGPKPLMTGYDTHDLCKRIGTLPGQYSWQIMNWRIAIKEVAISGSETNPLFRDKKFLGILYQALTGNKTLVRWLMDRCPDVVSGNSLEELADKMNALTGEAHVDLAQMRHDIMAYDAMIERDPALWNDDQLLRIRQIRQWRGDRLRTCRFQKILDRRAMPLIAIRERLISRKSMGGMLTDLHSRVLDSNDQAVPGLYAAGEAAGFGGGGISGIRSLEGTFLSNCIFNGRRAAQAIAGIDIQT